jgi:hypothetical protein
MDIKSLFAPVFAFLASFRQPRRVEDALAGINAIIEDLTAISKDRLDRAIVASDRASDLEDQIVEIEKQIVIANGEWQSEVDERNKALATISHIQTSFGLAPSKG